MHRFHPGTCQLKIRQNVQHPNWYSSLVVALANWYSNHGSNRLFTYCIPVPLEYWCAEKNCCSVMCGRIGAVLFILPRCQPDYLPASLFGALRFHTLKLTVQEFSKTSCSYPNPWVPNDDSRPLKRAISVGVNTLLSQERGLLTLD